MSTNTMFRIMDDLEDDEGFRGTVMAIGHVGTLESGDFELTYKLKNAWGTEKVVREGLLSYPDTPTNDCSLTVRAQLIITCSDGEVKSMTIMPDPGSPDVVDVLGSPDQYTERGRQLAVHAFENTSWSILEQLPATINWEA